MTNDPLAQRPAHGSHGGPSSGSRPSGGHWPFGGEQSPRTRTPTTFPTSDTAISQADGAA